MKVKIKRSKEKHGCWCDIPPTSRTNRGIRHEAERPICSLMRKACLDQSITLQHAPESKLKSDALLSPTMPFDISVAKGQWLVGPFQMRRSTELQRFSPRSAPIRGSCCAPSQSLKHAVVNRRSQTALQSTLLILARPSWITTHFKSRPKLRQKIINITTIAPRNNPSHKRHIPPTY